MRSLIFIGLVSATLLGCSGVFFQPYRVHVQTPKNLGLVYEDVNFQAGDSTPLHAWFLPAEGRAQGTILFLHGNAENISTHIMSVRWLPARGFNVFLLDYRGYGFSGGTSSLPGVQDDMDAALRIVLARKDVDPDRVVVLGQSLGGAIAIYNVAHSPYRQHIRALVVESAFASYREIAREKLAGFWLTWALQWPLSWTVSDEYSPSVAVANVSPIPLLIIHGDRDSIVPVHHGQELYDLAREPKEIWIVPGAGHIQAFQSKTICDQFVKYLMKVLSQPPAVHK